MNKCKWMHDEWSQICCNADCPLCADFCLVADVPGVCRYEDRGREAGMEPTEERANIQRKERYVSLEAVLKCVDEDGYAGEYDLGYGRHNLEFQELIKEIPAADVRPVVRGKWIHKPGCDGEWICNQCSHELEFIDGRTFGMPNYCPNCGADMKERAFGDTGRTGDHLIRRGETATPSPQGEGFETEDAERAVGDAGPYGGADDGRD